MAIPISYNFRNMRQRKAATLMTALGIALTVTTAIFIMSLLAGLDAAFRTSGDPQNVLVMRKGSAAELSSGIPHSAAAVLKTLPGVARDAQGQQMASGELVVIVILPRNDGTGDTNVTMRGMTPMGRELRPKIHLVSGRWPADGQREIVVSTSITKRFFNAAVGDDIRFGKNAWKVVGIFDAAGTAHDSEVWADVHQMATEFNREFGVSSVLLHAYDQPSAEALVQTVLADQRTKLDGQLETEYYASQTKSGGFIRVVGIIVAIVMAIGSSFAAMNTMYAAVAYRMREIATLRVLGFSRASILLSFVIESLMLALLGGIVGVVLMLPFDGMSTATSNSVTFSEVAFSLRVTPGVIATALFFSAMMGLIGGLLPAWHAARQNILTALRG